MSKKYEMTQEERDVFTKKFIVAHMKIIVKTVNTCLKLLGEGKYVYTPKPKPVITATPPA